MYNALLDRCAKHSDSSAEAVSLGLALETAWADSKEKCTEEEKQLVNWHFANLEFANASPLDRVSLKGWDQDDPYDFHGAHVFLSGGNGQLINALAKDVDILCNRFVTQIKYAESGVEVHVENTTYKGTLKAFVVQNDVLQRMLHW